MLSLMSCNWRKQDWPAFRWDCTRLEAGEKQFLTGGGLVRRGRSEWIQ